MKLPKTIELLSYKIKVQYDDNVKDLHGVWGFVDYDNLKICIQTPSEGQELLIEHTFLHEVVHFVLHVMGEDELNDNEKFVDMFAGLLHQALQKTFTDDK